MPEVWAGELGELRSSSTAGGGTALTTTATYIQFPALSKAGEKKKAHLFLTPRNYATAVVAQIITNPWLTILKTSDSMATLPTDYSLEAQDNDTGTSVTLSSLDTLANGDWLLVGSHQKFRGVYCDVDGTNGSGTAALTVEYWNGSVWVSLSATDGTSSTRSFDQDGLVSWTVPAAWRTTTFRSLYPDRSVQLSSANLYYSDVPLFWTRWSESAALDSSVTVDAMLAANRSTGYSCWIFGQTLEERIAYGFGGLGCIEAKTDAGTANLIVNVATIHEAEF